MPIHPLTRPLPHRLACALGTVLAVLAVLATPPAALAQTAPRRAPAPAPAHAVALPFYTPQDVALGLRRHWSAPLAGRFATRAQALAPAVQALCEAPAAQATPRLHAARAAWTQAMQDWGRYTGVALGPLLTRRALRQIDFMPARPALIERAIARAPASAADMERIGAPAKGLPALEWLLWPGALQPATPACAYAVQVAADIERMALALRQDSDAQAKAGSLPPEEASAAFAELLNQWVGGIERLRWTAIDKPRREASGRKGTPAGWPRAASGHTAGAWAAHWQALRQLAVLAAPNDVPATGGAALVPIEAYLRGRGLIALADRWAARIAATDAAMRAIRPRQPATLDRAVRELAQTKRLAEGDVATALDVRMGFSDADGD